MCRPTKTIPTILREDELLVEHCSTITTTLYSFNFENIILLHEKNHMLTHLIFSSYWLGHQYFNITEVAHILILKFYISLSFHSTFKSWVERSKSKNLNLSLGDFLQNFLTASRCIMSLKRTYSLLFFSKKLNTNYFFSIKKS